MKKGKKIALSLGVASLIAPIAAISIVQSQGTNLGETKNIAGNNSVVNSIYAAPQPQVKKDVTFTSASGKTQKIEVMVVGVDGEGQIYIQKTNQLTDYAVTGGKKIKNGDTISIEITFGGEKYTSKVPVTNLAANIKNNNLKKNNSLDPNSTSDKNKGIFIFVAVALIIVAILALSLLVMKTKKPKLA